MEKEWDLDAQLGFYPNWNTNASVVQVLSWRPRAVYFPKFATDEQCESIIKLAKSKLKPSSLALRKGETAESTKGVRTRYLLSNTLYNLDNLFVLLLENEQPIAYYFYVIWSCYFTNLHSWRNMFHVCSYKTVFWSINVLIFIFL